MILQICFVSMLCCILYASEEERRSRDIFFDEKTYQATIEKSDDVWTEERINDFKASELRQCPANFRGRGFKKEEHARCALYVIIFDAQGARDDFCSAGQIVPLVGDGFIPCVYASKDRCGGTLYWSLKWIIADGTVYRVDVAHGLSHEQEKEWYEQDRNVKISDIVKDRSE